MKSISIFKGPGTIYCIMMFIRGEYIRQISTNWMDYTNGRVNISITRIWWRELNTCEVIKSKQTFDLMYRKATIWKFRESCSKQDSMVRENYQQMQIKLSFGSYSWNGQTNGAKNWKTENSDWRCSFARLYLFSFMPISNSSSILSAQSSTWAFQIIHI